MLLDCQGTAGMHACAASMGWQHVLSLMIFMQTLVVCNYEWQMTVYEGLISDQRFRGANAVSLRPTVYIRMHKVVPLYCCGPWQLLG